ncbi:hypothetical protein DQ04_00671030 [Trypanosoma grayi]|uniref:hypothetical protein n=1 Tax=Trypanosoma grayi TaxID=71804 RepID=UPI0004F45F20|nr:hypothetical protein DQ04_00671030 [Trypanosoma grayi]KEG14000.1 hypothetical protein DQ04_00671030 [Trypanosoma grayi]
MPRAYYKPFTVYEEAVGFHGTKRNAYICCAFLFGGLLFKVLVLSRYSTASNFSALSELENDPQYQAVVAERMQLAENLASREAMRRAMSARRAPPA